MSGHKLRSKGAQPFWGPFGGHLPKWPSVCQGTKAISANLKRHQSHFQTLIKKFQVCVQTDAEKVENKMTECASRAERNIIHAR